MSAVVKEIESSGSAQDERRPAERRHRNEASASPFMALLLLALAFTGWASLQTYLLAHEAYALNNVRENQSAPMSNAEKLRQALDALARDTARLAGEGNPNALLIVEELRKRGVTINPEAPPATK